MNPFNSLRPADRVADILSNVQKKGVRLWSENGQLHYKAPVGVLTQEELDRLRESRGQIVALLERATHAKTAEPTLEPSPQLDRAPLAFTQLAHWYLYRLSERRAVRQIASATRLRGRLNINALCKGFSKLVLRHDALRTRIILCDGIPAQEIATSVEFELKVSDLSALSVSLREAELHRLIDELILDPIDVSSGPLFGARLLRVSDNEHVLVVAMEHMISDEASMSILLRDLFTAYMQVLRGRTVSLPEIQLQFPKYAGAQRKAQKLSAEKLGAYWNERLKGCQRLRFPVDNSLGAGTRCGWGTVPIRVGRDLKEELRGWCRLKRTTLVMSIFTVYVGLVLRWCNVSQTVIQYQTDGRAIPEIENTIGYFASPLLLRIELLDDDRFVDLMNRATQEYCTAYEHADCSYLDAQVPRPEFTRNSYFNWVPKGPNIDLIDLDGSEDAIICSPVPFENPMLKKLERDNEPSILLFDTDDEIAASVNFPLNRFSVGTMERFGRNFLMFIMTLLRQPEARVKDIVLV